MYDAIAYVFLFLRFFANSAFGFFYASKLLEIKVGKKTAFLLWTAVYMVFQFTCYFTFNRIFHIENILSILLDMAVILLLQRILFKGSFGRELFAALSLSAGKELLILLSVVLDYNLLSDLSDCIILHIANTSPEIFARYGDDLMLISFTLITVIAVGTYVALLWLYLKLISKSLSEKNRNLTVSELLMLILPSLSSISITVTIKMMNTNEDMVFSSIYERYPAAKLWVPIAALLMLGTVVASAIIFGKLIRYNDEKLKRRLLEAQIAGMEKEIAEIKDIYSDIRGLRHDMHNHIANISLYVKSTAGIEDKTLSGYLGQMQKTVDRLDFSYNTGDPITDIIIRRRAQESEKKGITLKSDFRFPKNLDFDAFDIGIILDNALENCIAACEEAEGERVILLNSYVKGSLMFIETENRFSGEISVDKETGLPLGSKKGSEDHGLGLSNIRRCAEKYMGGIDIDISGDKFTLTVMLHGKHK